MKTIIPTMLLILVGILAHADIVYNVTFEDPPHVVGQEPATGISSDCPLSPASGWEIRDDIAGFGSQSAVLAGGTGGGLLNFGPGSVFDSGIHSILWDASVLTLDISSGLQVATLIGGGDGALTDLGINFLANGNLTVYDPADSGNEEVIDTWLPGEVFQFQVLMNLDTDTYDFFLNGSQVIYGQPLEADASFTGVSYQRPFSSAGFALDNFRWEVVPEPSSILLFLCGGCVLAGLRRRLAEA